MAATAGLILDRMSILQLGRSGDLKDFSTSGRFDMRKIVVLFLSFVLLFGLFAFASAKSKESAKPFGFTIDKTSYEEALRIVEARKWRYGEYEKRQFGEIDSKSPLRGKNTFLKALPGDLEGVKSLFIFFGNDSTVEALMVVIDPKMFDSVLQVLDSKYHQVERSLSGEKLAEPYAYATWEKGSDYIELQKVSAFRVRVLYVNKAVYANYRDFLTTSYERYHGKLEKKDWMNEL
jgi:hypothetical protein